MNNNANILIYGAEQICASCVNLPSSKETYEWLEAAISRKFPEQPVNIRYIDIFNPPNDEELKKFSEKVINEDLFYPVITMDGNIIAEGNPRLKDVYAELEKRGYQAVK